MKTIKVKITISDKALKKMGLSSYGIFKNAIIHVQEYAINQNISLWTYHGVLIPKCIATLKD